MIVSELILTAPTAPTAWEKTKKKTALWSFRLSCSTGGSQISGWKQAPWSASTTKIPGRGEAEPSSLLMQHSASGLASAAVMCEREWRKPQNYTSTLEPNPARQSAQQFMNFNEANMWSKLSQRKTFRLEQARETSRKVRRTQLYFDERIFHVYV